MEKIAVTNNLRRPVMFRAPGISIRLGPGETASLPSAYAEAPELELLCRKKAVTLTRDPGAPVSQPAKKKKPNQKKTTDNKTTDNIG